MKKFLLAVLILLASPSITMAQSTNSADVDTLTQSQCTAVLNINMRYRMRDSQTNNEVSALQDFLNAEGYLSSQPTGFFGLATFAAVKKFQSASGFAPTGYVGPLTREKINAMSCGGNITVTNPSNTTTTTYPVTTVATPPTPWTTNQFLSAGCTSTVGYSPTTGQRCYTPTITPVLSNFPAGCTSNIGYSTTTGQPCSVSSADYIKALEEARLKGADAAIKSTLANVRATAELYYDSHLNSYTGVCTDNNGNYTVSKSKEYLLSIVKAEEVVCNDSATQYAMSARLKSAGAGYWCVDSTGASKQTASTLPAGQLSCSTVVAPAVTLTASPSSINKNISTSETLSIGFIASIYNLALTQYPAFTWELIGNVPSGVKLSTEGAFYAVLRGTSAQTGNYSFIIRLKNPAAPGVYADVPVALNVTTPIPTATSTQTITTYAITSISGNQSSYTTNAPLSIQIKAVVGGGGGMTASSDNGYNVQAYVFPASDTGFSNYLPPNPAYSYNGTYNPATGLWNVQMNTPSSPGSYNLRVVLYCSKFGTTCYNAGGYGTESVKILPFTVQNTTTTSVPTVEFIGTPTLILQYDSLGKESMLVGKATVKVTAGSSPVVFTNTGVSGKSVYFSLYNSTRGETSGNFAGNDSPTVIPAGTSVTFTTTISQSVKTLFAGSYSITPEGLQYYANGAYLSVPKTSLINTRSSNSVTIIGETSPYISSAIQPTASGVFIAQILIGGVRFDGTSNQVNINGITKTLSAGASNLGNNTIITVNLSDFGITSAGNYVVQVSTSNGASNKVNVNVTVPTTTTTTPSITVTSPNGGETLTVGQTKRITWNSSTIDSVTITYIVGPDFNPGGGFTGLLANSIPNIGYYDWNVNIPTGTQVKVRIFGNTVQSNGGASSIIDDSDNFFTVASSVVTPPTVEFVGTPTIGLQYSSINGNEELVGKATVKINAGSASINIGYNSENAQVARILPFNNGNFVSSNSLRYSAVGSPVCVPTATAGCLIPANSSMTFNITNTAPVKELFAGTYFLKPDAIQYVDINGANQTIQSTSFINGNSSNTMTIVGETSPYLLSASQPTSAGAYLSQVNILGIRFHQTTNTVTVNGISKTLPSGASDTGNNTVIVFNLSDFGIASSGNYAVQVTHPTEGTSNIVYVNVSAPVALAPLSTQYASVIGAFATTPTQQAPATIPASTLEYEWIRNLEVNSPYADDVSALQTALKKEGVYTGDITGGFYTQTFTAVKEFQSKYGIESTGFVGPTTRAKLNELY